MIPHSTSSSTHKARHMETHDNRIKALATQLKGFVDSKTPFRIYHGDTMSTRLSTRLSDQVLDITSLNNIININPAARTARVEPNVSFEKLVTATMKGGLIPQVVPSFPSITVGGAFVGTAAQSSSFAAGFFEDCVSGVEVILGNGSVEKARQEGENAELFRDLKGSCGTLGLVTLLDVKLIRAQSYVELEYIPVYSAAEALEILQRCYKDSNINYLDSILYSSKVGVIMLGRLTNSRPSRPARFTRAKDNWFYLHAHSQIPHTDACSTCPFSPPASDDMDGRHARDVIPLRDYVFRYDRGNMWMGIHGQDPASFGSKSRMVIDWFARTRRMMKAVHHSGRSQDFIVQDITVPEVKGLEFLRWMEQRVGIWPVWICPISASSGSPQRSHRSNSGKLLNINIWGLKPHLSTEGKEIIGHEAYEYFVEDNKMIEEKMRQLRGFKWPYGQHFQSEEEFWKDLDAEAVGLARRKWHAEGMPTLWDKLRNEHDGYVDKGWLPKALVKTMLGMDHLLDQSSKLAKQY